ncbi:MAG: hypothetical protein C5B54_00725, partial [Acidobacteria bacterium]
MKLTFPLFLLLAVGCLVVYPRWGDSQIAVYYGNAIQGAGLLLAGYNLYRVTMSFRPDDAPRGAWGRLSI